VYCILSNADIAELGLWDESTPYPEVKPVFKAWCFTFLERALVGEVKGMTSHL
jgi:hypothetical protein